MVRGQSNCGRAKNKPVNPPGSASAIFSSFYEQVATPAAKSNTPKDMPPSPASPSPQPKQPKDHRASKAKLSQVSPGHPVYHPTREKPPSEKTSARALQLPEYRQTSPTN
jgi:hypothetical protein